MFLGDSLAKINKDFPKNTLCSTLLGDSPNNNLHLFRPAHATTINGKFAARPRKSWSK